jgi:hypothetical protein
LPGKEQYPPAPQHLVGVEDHMSENFVFPKNAPAQSYYTATPDVYYYTNFGHNEQYSTRDSCPSYSCNEKKSVNGARSSSENESSKNDQIHWGRSDSGSMEFDDQA